MAAAIADAQLVREARAGDPAALGVLLERHRAPLYASVLSMLREREAAQDAVQETFLVALRRLGDLRDPDAAASWLHAIVRNTSLMHIRRTGREHIDHARLVEQRAREWNDALDEVLATGSAVRYAADCAPDVVVAAPSLEYRERGIADHRRDVEDTAAAGVRLRLTGVVASRGVTIVEGDYLNPPHDPHHCPTTHTEVRIHPDGQTTRLLLYYPIAGGSGGIGADD